MSDDLAGQVWRLMAAVVHENRDGWKRAVIEQSGLPFSRIRVLKRLVPAPMTVKGVADAATLDAPAATVAINDLEERGLVVRQIDPSNRRSKTVSITAAGRELVARIDAVEDPAPAAVAALTHAELVVLQALLKKLG
ncbi:MarR family winged helix-turn-helix transcriptional regulator [Mycolicibacterium sp. P9-22]|uniref:MarR family winged helix-turn-helix transcriptional regulator n=1 Tax=Mycolicibacterium sp. P9-22 TaxID=2024613 RepID=UPI0011ED0C8B|nr:MarR family winged helix-turn-helix transcriptional regulator [Mycolicibacterium sp. P9-22]KAA0117150.1 MarR family transcriptional regulator [Mycolicibacterium sp. P9-22]